MPDQNMAVLLEIATRRSVREFTSDSIPEEHFDLMIEAAIRAPNPESSEPWLFQPIGNARLIASMTQKVEGRFDELIVTAQSANLSRKTVLLLKGLKRWCRALGRAPVIVAVYRQPEVSLMFETHEELDAALKVPALKESLDFVLSSHSVTQGVAAAIQNFSLQAHAMGYGTCWMTGPLAASDLILEEIQPEDPSWELLALIAVGVEKTLDGGEAPQPRKRKKSVENVTDPRFWS